MFWSEVYEHAEFGTIKISWSGARFGLRSFLIAIEPELWTPAEEVADCIRWARNLQLCEEGEGGDAGTRLVRSEID